MNKLTIQNGGMPYTGDDLIYLQESLKNGIGMVLKGLSSKPTLIVSGCDIVIENDTVTVDPGVVMIDWELFEFAGGSFPYSDWDSKAIQIAITYDPSGNEVFADNVAKDTYELRKAIIGDVQNIDSEIPFSDENKYIWLGSEVIKMKSVSRKINLPLLPGASGTLKAYVVGDQVTLMGTVSSSLSNGAICQLPDDLKPDNDSNLFFQLFSSLDEMTKLTITPDGHISTSIAVSHTLYIAGVVFFK